MYSQIVELTGWVNPHSSWNRSAPATPKHSFKITFIHDHMLHLSFPSPFHEIFIWKPATMRSKNILYSRIYIFPRHQFHKSSQRLISCEIINYKWIMCSIKNKTVERVLPHFSSSTWDLTKSRRQTLRSRNSSSLILSNTCGRVWYFAKPNILTRAF